MNYSTLGVRHVCIQFMSECFNSYSIHVWIVSPRTISLQAHGTFVQMKMRCGVSIRKNVKQDEVSTGRKGEERMTGESRRRGVHCWSLSECISFRVIQLRTKRGT